MVRSLTQVRRVWEPKCARALTTFVFHSGARAQVAVESADAWRALDQVMQRHGYVVRSRDTGGYNCRQVAGGGATSLHAYGAACDINWNTNPLRRDNVLHTDMPRGMVDDILAIRTVGGEQVFGWGGDYRTFKDPHHYELLASPAELLAGIDWATVRAPRAQANRPGSFATLQPGDRGPTVAKLQQLLATSGFDPGGADGIYGAKTEVAVRAYQASRQLDVDGIVGTQTWTALLTGQPMVSKGDSPVKRDLRVDPMARPVLKVGAKGDVVLEMQKLLAAAGHQPGAADGMLGPRTVAALRAFQQAQGLEVDGICGPRTWAALAAAGFDPMAMPELTRGTRRDQVTLLQQLLMARGFEPGEVDGIFGEATEAAVKAFQTARGLGVDGKCGPHTWAALSVSS